MTTTELKSIGPVSQKAVNTFLVYLNIDMPRYFINNRVRVAAFIAQVLHESLCLKYTREIASGSAYEGRLDLGNIIKGDGVKFKGRGLLQITGRNNYTRLAKEWNIPIDKNPDLLSTPKYAVKSACWFWQKHGLNQLADKTEGKPEHMLYFNQITKIINGGYNGLLERQKYFLAALTVLS